METLVVSILVCWLIGFLAYKAVLLFFFPDIFRDQQRQKHEREMAARAGSQQAWGLVGAVLRLFGGR